MTRTVIESKSKTVVIGFDEPFCVIGERINPTGRKKLAAELEAGDFSTVERDVAEQVACGAMVLDVNSGAVFTNRMAEDPRYADNNFVEPPLMRELVLRIQAWTDVPLCIDSSVPAALEAGLEAAEGRPLLNSVTGEEERLERVLPLVKKYNVPVVAISNDDTGISEDPDVRFAVAKKIVRARGRFRHPAHDIVVDPLVMPVGAMGSAGRQVFALVRRLREELGVNTTCGASNISFGLPHRHGINAAFLPMAIGCGHDQRDHEPRPRAGNGGDPRRELPDEPRSQRHGLDRVFARGRGDGRGRQLCRGVRSRTGRRRPFGPRRRGAAAARLIAKAVTNAADACWTAGCRHGILA
jgi:5-methyltetrahydrofolate--homocysteine methyltransferase